MSTKSKIGKEWVKCQVTLAETGETLHLTFAPGQNKKKIVVNVDGRTDVGFIELAGDASLAPPYDAVLSWQFKGDGTTPARRSQAEAPKPVPAVAPAKPVAVTSPEPAEEIPTPVVQETAADTTPVAGGKRGAKRTPQG